MHPRREQYSDYLRLLDAREVNATNNQVAKIMYPHLPNEYSKLDGERQVRRDRTMAEVLRDNPWRI